MVDLWGYMKNQPKEHRKYMPITHNANMTFRCHTLIPEKLVIWKRLRGKDMFGSFIFVIVFVYGDGQETKARGDA